MSPTWSSPLYERVADMVREESGLVFPDARVRDVEAAVRRAAARQGMDPSEQLLDLLRTDESAREALVAELTIGETYFNRDPAQFDLLRWRILPRLLSEREERPVRVWSAGCASGEEPYSVAMLFDELDALDRADIVGSDIARGRLEDAQRALYSRWSLRGMSDDTRDRYFRERGRYFELTPRLRQHVDFRYLNLAEDAFPSLSSGIWGMDVILCRNVLIYFDRPTVELVARRLLASLSEHGWLILGASDPAIAELVECDVVLTDAGLVYRRAGTVQEPDLRREAPATEPLIVQPTESVVADTAPQEAVDALFERLAVHDADEHTNGTSEPRDHGASLDDRIAAAYAARDYGEVCALAESARRNGELAEHGAVTWLRALANQGLLADAAHAATELEERMGASAELLYVHAVVLLQTGRVDEAAALCRRALYLDRGLIVAHLALADALRRRGEVDASRRSLRNAAALLARLDREDLVPGSDGETAGRLAEMTKTRLDLLGATA